MVRSPDAGSPLKLVVLDSHSHFLPLTYTRPVYMLRVGLHTPLERMLSHLRPDEALLWTRSYLKEAVSEWTGKPVNDADMIDEPCLMVDGSVLMDRRLSAALRDDLRRSPNTVKVFVDVAGTAVAGWCQPEAAQRALEAQEPLELLSSIAGDRAVLPSVRRLESPWQMLGMNSQLLQEDILAMGVRLRRRLKRLGRFGRRVFVMEGAEVEPNVVLRSDSGPVLVGEGAVVEAGARVVGPAYVGSGSIVRGGAQVRGGSNVGPVCRVGGEVEETIFLGYSNKQHFGFTGHMIVGEWVNIGAGFSNSDVKNTYGTVRSELLGVRVDTGVVKYGGILADMVKVSIGAYLYTGRLVGVSSHIHGHVRVNVPGFTIHWPGGDLETLEPESALRTQERMMGRRGLSMTDGYRRLVQRLFEETRHEREAAGAGPPRHG